MTPTIRMEMVHHHGLLCHHDHSSNAEVAHWAIFTNLRLTLVTNSTSTSDVEVYFEGKSHKRKGRAWNLVLQVRVI